MHAKYDVNISYNLNVNELAKVTDIQKNNQRGRPNVLPIICSKDIRRQHTFLMPLPLPPGLRDFPLWIIFRLDFRGVPPSLPTFGSELLCDDDWYFGVFSLVFDGGVFKTGNPGDVTLSLILSGTISRSASWSSYSSVSSSSWKEADTYKTCQNIKEII